MSDNVSQTSRRSTQQPYGSQQSQYQQFDSHTSYPLNTKNQFGATEFQENEDTGRSESFPLRGFGDDIPNTPPNPLSNFLAEFLNAVVRLSIDVSRELYTNSSVIVLAAGLAGSVHHFASPLNSLANAALDAGLDGSVAVAKYVGLAFLIKTALTPIHERFAGEETSAIVNTQKTRNIEYEVAKAKAKANINSHVISYLTPMALAWIVAYTQGIPVRLGAATVYTIGTFGIMKVLSRGYDYALTKWGQREREC